jgi:hypothetical protein
MQPATQVTSTLDLRLLRFDSSLDAEMYLARAKRFSAVRVRTAGPSEHVSYAPRYQLRTYHARTKDRTLLDATRR